MYGERRGGFSGGRGRSGGGFGRDGGGGGFGGGRGSFDRGFDKPKPVKVGQEFDVTISDVGAKGDGITKVENFIVFVPGASKGEHCRIRIKEVANKFAIAEKVGEGGSSGSDEPAEEPAESESMEAADEADSDDGASADSDEEA